jgi:uncharacterized sulfatase
MINRLLLGFLFVFVGVKPLAKVPNILFVISDDQSYPHASAYGCRGINTPGFDKVANKGVLFHNAISGSPGCSPSRASVLTGRYHWMIEHAGTHASTFNKKYSTFPDLLEKSGYWVGYTGKGWGPGKYKDGGFNRNPAGPMFSSKKKKPNIKGISSTDYTENFNVFLSKKPEGKPFCFWLGGHEPHRVFEKGIGLRKGKKLSDIDVPAFLPDTPEIRSDILDYYVEIEWFDSHLAKILSVLDESDELGNTMVIVTSDNGMAFPRAKANCYEFGVHVPLAIMWTDRYRGGRFANDPVGFVDLTATILDAAELNHPNIDQPSLAPIGLSLIPLLLSEKSGHIDASRTHVYSGRERHSSSRYKNWTYPQRCLRSEEYIYIRNFRPDRWPAGDPQKFDSPGKLGQMHGGYHDIDACPTLDFLIENRNNPKYKPFFHLSVNKRPGEELFNIKKDPACLNNLALDPAFLKVTQKYRDEMSSFLKETGDPRANANGDIWESYRRYSRMRSFPRP